VIAVVIVDHGSRRAEANDAFLEVVARFGERGRFQIVEPAHMEIASPTIEDAFERAVARGASEIVVHPYFLSPGRHWQSDIPSLCDAASRKHGSVPFRVTEPLGLSERILDVIDERIDAVLAGS